MVRFGVVRAGPGCAPAGTVELVAGSDGMVPLAARVDGAPGDELITSGGVAQVALGAPATLTLALGGASPRAWDVAAITDWNGDGRQDVVGAVDDVHGIDVLRALPGPGGWSATRIETTGNVLRTRGGDFDGDLYGDVLFLEAGARLTASIAYGQPAGGQPAIVAVARFDTVGDIFPERLLGPAGPDNATDFIVTHEGGGSIFFGAGSRQPTAPLFIGQGPMAPAAQPLKLLVADFSHEPANDLQHWPDLVALDPGNGTTTLASYYGFGRGPGVFDQGTPPDPVGLAPATYAGVSASTDVWTWVREASPPVGRHTGRYPVALSSATEQMVVFDPIPGKPRVSTLDLPPGLGAPRAAFPHPAPGEPLIASFASGVVMAFVVARESGTGPFDVAANDLTELLADQGFPGCGHATTMRLGRLGALDVPANAGAAELVFACEDGTSTKIVVLTDSTVPPRLLRDLGPVPPVAQLAAGDLTGDGVDDLVVLVDSDPRRAIHLVQCSLRGETLDCPDQPAVPTEPPGSP
jgi:hypothetical protein